METSGPAAHPASRCDPTTRTPARRWPCLTQRRPFVRPGSRESFETASRSEEMADDGFLLLHELTDPGIRKVEQCVQRVAAEWQGFGRALHFDEPAIASLHHVHID